MESNNQQTERTPDQWKDYGHCAVCRRKDYCGTPCKAHKRFMYLWHKVMAGKAANAGQS